MSAREHNGHMAVSREFRIGDRVVGDGQLAVYKITAIDWVFRWAAVPQVATGLCINRIPLNTLTLSVPVART
jgi:hypothetical protein